MKRIIGILVLIFMLVGCSNVKVETNKEIDEAKETYLTLKDNLDKKEQFISKNDLPCNITLSIDKVNEEEISYRAIIDEPKENMNDISALLIHNYFTEDIFPSIGIFDEKIDLIMGNDELKGIELVGYIETTKEEDELDLDLKLYIEYTDEKGEKKQLFYKFDEMTKSDIV